MFIQVNNRPLNLYQIVYWYSRDNKDQDNNTIYSLYYRLSDGRVIQEDFSTDEERTAKMQEVETSKTNNPKAFVGASYDAQTGIITFTSDDGTTTSIDLPLELLIQSGSYDSQTEEIILVLANGDTIRINVADLINIDEAVVYDDADNVNLRNNIAVKESAAYFGTSEKHGWSNLASVKTYNKGQDNELIQSEIGSTTVHTNLNSLDRPTIETPAGKEDIAYTSDIPEKLPSPNSLSISLNGSELANYDGSEAKSASFTVNAETVPMSSTDDTSVSERIKEYEELIINFPLRTLQDRVYTKEEIFAWFGVTDDIELKNYIAGKNPIYVKYGISLSYNPHYYKFPVDYIAYESADQVKLVFNGLNTRDDVTSKYEIILNLDGTLIEGTNSNVGLTITSLESNEALTIKINNQEVINYNGTEATDANISLYADNIPISQSDNKTIAKSLEDKQDSVPGVIATTENLTMDRLNDASNQMRLKIGDDVIATFPAPPTTFTPNTTFVAKEIKTYYEELGLTPVTVNGYEFGSTSDPSGGNINYFTEENGPYLVFTTMDIMEPLNTNGGYVILLKSILPTYLPNPNVLTVQFNGTDIASYDGSSAKTVNIEGVTEEQLTQALAQESSARQKQDSLLEEEIAGKLAPANIKSGDGINLEQDGMDVTISSNIYYYNWGPLSKTSDTSEEGKAFWTSIYNKCLAGEHPIVITTVEQFPTDPVSQYTVQLIGVPTALTEEETSSYEMAYKTAPVQYTANNGSFRWYQLCLEFTVRDGVVTQIGKSQFQDLPLLLDFQTSPYRGYPNNLALSTGNTREFTPTQDYHPATKKYVDDQIYIWDGNDTEEAREVFQKIINNYFERKPIRNIAYVSISGTYHQYYGLASIYQHNETSLYFVFQLQEYRGFSSVKFGVAYSNMLRYNAIISINDNNEIISLDGGNNYSSYILGNNNNILGMNNATEYTPTGDYNPATKKYVDDNLGDLPTFYITDNSQDNPWILDESPLGWYIFEKAIGTTTTVYIKGSSNNAETFSLYIRRSSMPLLYYKNYTEAQSREKIAIDFKILTFMYSEDNTGYIIIKDNDSPTGINVSNTYPAYSSYVIRGDLNKTISAQHTYNILPHSSQTPTDNEDFVNKKYVDDTIVNQSTIPETISGLKTFTTLPESSVVPTTDNQLVNKQYVDSTLSTALGNINTILATLTTVSEVTE